ncbi:MAG: DUF4432 family protein [Candidatus Neomarinimicrobiota bacterium]
MQLYGKTWTRREIEKRIGRIEQIGGLKHCYLAGGKAEGVEQIQVRSGAGLSYEINVSRGMDIGLAEYCGSPLTWQSSNGVVHPAHWHGGPTDWLKTAVGGLLMTCGLTQVGSPCTDGPENLPLHGDAHQLPAELLCCEGEWNGDEYEMTIKGCIRQSRIFGENITLTRTIQSKLGENRISIDDKVKNVEFAQTPHMLLYHFNFGFPLMTAETEIQFPSQKVVARDSDIPIENFNRWQEPQNDYRERVYYHEELETTNGTAAVVIRQPHFPVGNSTRPVTVRLSWQTENLPRLVQWKMPGEGIYVLGIEPANCLVEGRVAERNRGTLQILEPGESRHYALALEVIEGNF